MKRNIFFVIFATAPALQLIAAEALPEGFARTPNCTNDAICLDSAAVVSQATFFDAIRVAIKHDGLPGSLVYEVIEGNGENEVQVLVANRHSPHSSLYEMERINDEWTIVRNDIGRE